MIENLLQGVKQKFKDLYPEYNLYESKSKDISKPAFVIQIVNYTQEKCIGNRNLNTIEVDVECLLEKETSTINFFIMAENLNQKLNLLQIDNQKYRIYNKQTTNKDNELHYSFEFKIYTSEQCEVSPKIGSFDTNTKPYNNWQARRKS